MKAEERERQKKCEGAEEWKSGEGGGGKGKLGVWIREFYHGVL